LLRTGSGLSLKENIMPLTVDTLEFAKTLEDAGVPSHEAEAHARAVVQLLRSGAETVATTTDVKACEAALRTELNTTKREIGGGLKALQKDLLAELPRREQELTSEWRDSNAAKIPRDRLGAIEWLLVGNLVALLALLAALLLR
jgi:hypothetical protein